MSVILMVPLFEELYLEFKLWEIDFNHAGTEKNLLQKLLIFYIKKYMLNSMYGQNQYFMDGNLVISLEYLRIWHCGVETKYDFYLKNA